MALKIPAGLKKEFKKGFDEYIKVMGKDVQAYMKPYEVSCPNCIYDSFQKRSSNNYDINFKKPVNIFPGTSAERKIYPAPFNVSSAPGVEYDPSTPVSNHKILNSTICPVCRGSGSLTYDNVVCFRAVVTRGISKTNVVGPDILDLSAGRDGLDVIRLKSFSCNYSVVRDAQYFIVEGVKAKIETPPRLKGLGSDAIVEVYLNTIQEDNSSSTRYDTDSRINSNTIGNMSNQASIPPSVAGDDVW